MSAPWGGGPLRLAFGHPLLPLTQTLPYDGEGLLRAASLPCQEAWLLVTQNKEPAPWPSSVGRCVGFSCSDRKVARQLTARQPTVRVKRRNPQKSLLRRSPTVHSSRTVGCSLVDLARSSIRPINASGHIRIALVDLVRLRQARHRSESSSTHDSGDEEQWLAGWICCELACPWSTMGNSTEDSRETLENLAVPCGRG